MIIGILMATLAACSGSGTSTTPSTSGTVIGSAHDALPPTIKQSGEFKAASSFDYGPFAYIDEDTASMAGYEYEIVNAMADRLGVKAKWTNLGSFESLIPATQSGQTDVAVDGFSITRERLPAVSFVYQSKADIAVLVRAGNPTNIDPKNLCGTKLAAGPSTLQASAFKSISGKCVAAGKEPIDLRLIDKTASATAAVLSGQVDGQGWGSATGAFTEKQNPALQITDPVPGYATAYGIILQKSDTGAALGKAMTIAMDAMIEDGTVRIIGAKFGFPTSALPTKSMFVNTDADFATLLASDSTLESGQG